VNDTKATDYATRVWNGQAAHLPRVERMRRVSKALAGQGLTLSSPRAFYGAAAFDSALLQMALAKFNAPGPLSDRLDRVKRVIDEMGLDLGDVLKATQGYLKLKTRKARKARLYS
jgi:hypothetical protein